MIKPGDPMGTFGQLATAGLAGNFGTLTGVTAGAPPQGTTITPGTTAGQVGTSYDSNQNSLGSQQALLEALRNQGGIQNQGDLYNRQLTLSDQLGGANGVGAQQNALDTQKYLNSGLLGSVGNVNSAYGQSQDLANEMARMNGVGNLNSALQSQQSLAGQQQGVLGQYQNIAQGQGPNPALAMLNQQTGTNVANQAALMAGQRGAGANVGLTARQAAQQGAATQQQAVGQGATLQAEQQLNALQGITGQQQAIGQTNQSVAGIAGQQAGMQQAQQQALAGQAQAQLAAAQQGTAAQNQYGAGLVGQQQAQQQALAGQANAMAGQQIGATTANTQAQQSEQQLLQNALSSQNAQNVSMQGNINSANAGLANTALQGRQSMAGGVLSAIGKGAAALAKGGEVQKPVHMYDGGTPPAADPVPTPAIDAAPAGAPAPAGPQSSFGKFLKGAWAGANKQGASGAANSQGEQPQTSAGALKQGSQDFAEGLGKYAMSSPKAAAPVSEGMSAGPDLASADIAAMGAKGGKATKHDLRDGGDVRAKNAKEKAVKTGNSYANDKIPAYLSEGEVVIPRSIMQGRDPARSAADFVAKVLAKRGRKSA